MRGEHTDSDMDKLQAEGSSPHARGAQQEIDYSKYKARIIPACAGSTVFQNKRAAPSWDHPRMRGEHRVAGDMTQIALGSSPHARGARCSQPW